MTRQTDEQRGIAQPVRIPMARGELHGDLVVPAQARGCVLFAHGSGSSRHSPRNRHVAGVLQSAGFATFLLDLLSEEEERGERAGRMLRFDLGLLAGRLLAATEWTATHAETRELPIGYFGASTGAAAALMAAAHGSHRVHAIVSRGGRPDLAGPSILAQVRAPTLLVVGSRDPEVLALNREAIGHMRCEHSLQVVPGATHLFEERGALERVAVCARDWFLRYLTECGADAAKG